MPASTWSIITLLQQGIRASLADGWGGSMIATELQDVLFGTPTPVLGQINLGVLKEDEVNVIIHGHEPLLSEVIVAAAHDPEIMAWQKTPAQRGSIWRVSAAPPTKS